MAAPSGIEWGSIAGGYGRIGIYVELTSTATQTTRHTEIWFWSKYSVQDPSNTLYYNDNATSATTSRGAVDIATYVATGSGWSSSNQQKIAEYDYTFTRGTSSSIRSVAAKLTGVAVVDATMTAVTSYAIPALSSYAVQYNANGGSGAPSSQTKYYGKSLTLSSTKPTRTGYDFQGWATSASGSVAYAPGASYTNNSAVTLYAVWKAKTYTVKYDANGGSGAPSNQTKTYGKTLTLSSTKPTRTGYTFKGWATSASGSVVYDPGDAYTANSAATLYAKWKTITYTVTYNANGGSGAPSSQTKTYGKSLTLSSTKPTRAGYTFVSWNTKADGKGTSYAPGASYTTNAALSLYAIWSVNTYTITYDANGGTLTGDTTQTKTHGTALQLTGTATRTDYTFIGWATSENGSVVYAPGASYTADAAVTLYAVWELSYIKPKISSFSVTRCVKNSDNTYSESDEGTYCRVKFTWETSIASPTALIEWKETADESESVTLTGTNGTVNRIISGSFTTEKSFSIKLTVSDGKGSQSATKNLPGLAFPIDVKAGGKGVAIGKPAETDNTLDVGYKGWFRKDVEIGEKTTNADGKIGIHLDSDGFIQVQRRTTPEGSDQVYHPYIGFYLNDSTAANGQIRVNGSTERMEFLSADGYKFDEDLYLPYGTSLRGITTADKGNKELSLIYLNGSNNTIVGYGGYNEKIGVTNIYGNTIQFGVRVGGADGTTTAFYKPYYEKGDSISTIWWALGFVAHTATVLYFTIPLAKPVIGDPAITISTGEDQLLIRQNGKYIFGSSSGKTPSSYSAKLNVDGNAIKITAVFDNSTNVVTHCPCVVSADITITFS